MMPIKRTPRPERETPAARALRAAIDEELSASLTRLGADGKTKAQRERRAAKDRRRMDRVMSNALAKWDAASPAWREKEGAKILASARRYDRSATLPADGGREIYAVHEYADREQRRWEAKRTSVDYYAAHHASAAREVAEASATRPAPATDAPPVVDELAERRKARRRRRAGHAGYIDPRLFDFDDWEE